MDPAVIAGLVKEQSPDHASHTQDSPRTVASDGKHDTVEVRCNCRPGVSVGLTIRVPVVVEAPPAKEKLTFDLRHEHEKGKVGDGA